MNNFGPNIHNFCITTCIYDLGRDSIGSFSRPFSFYLNNLITLLKNPFNFVIFTDAKTKDLILKE